MLNDLTKENWLSILNIPEKRIPMALIWRCTRNLKTQYQAYRQHFTDILEIGTPNGILEDVFIGSLVGNSVAYASVYGAPMASEVVHVFGVLGTCLVIQTGCYGALAEGIVAGDLFMATEAYCGEGASQYYDPGGKIISDSLDLREWIAAGLMTSTGPHAGCIFTTSALFAEGMDEVDTWFQAGFSAVDMETATTFTVDRYFGMERASILFAFDNPRQREHILLSDTENDERRDNGNRQMIAMTLDAIKKFGIRNL